MHEIHVKILVARSVSTPALFQLTQNHFFLKDQLQPQLIHCLANKVVYWNQYHYTYQHVLKIYMHIYIKTNTVLKFSWLAACDEALFSL